MKNAESISILVLAGGIGRRFGMYKPLIKLGNKPLILWVLDSLFRCRDYLDVSNIIISLKFKWQKDLINKMLPERIRRHIKFIFDSLKVQGALIGIISASDILSDSEFFFVCGADQPLINCELVEYLVKKICETNSDGGLPKWSYGYIEPLTALYRTQSFLSIATSEIQKNVFSLHKIISKLEISYISIENELSGFINSFLNINDKNDLICAKELLKSTNHK